MVTLIEENLLRIKFDVKPVACARPRLGKFVTYTPKSTSEYKKLLSELLHLELRNPEVKAKIERLYDEPIMMLLTFSMPIPKRLIRKKEPQPWKSSYPTQKPDVDNLYKSVADVLSGKVYRDDSQVVCAAIRKIYDDRPYVSIEVGTVELSKMLID